MKGIKPKLIIVKNEYALIWPYLLAKKLGNDATVSFMQGDAVIEVIDARNPSFRDYYTIDIADNSRIIVYVKYNTGSVEFLWRTNPSKKLEMIFWHYEDDDVIPNTHVKEKLAEFLNEIDDIENRVKPITFLTRLKNALVPKR